MHGWGGVGWGGVGHVITFIQTYGGRTCFSVFSGTFHSCVMPRYCKFSGTFHVFMWCWRCTLNNPDPQRFLEELEALL